MELQKHWFCIYPSGKKLFLADFKPAEHMLTSLHTYNLDNTSDIILFLLWLAQVEVC